MKSMVIFDTEDHISEDAVRQSATCKIPGGSLLIVNRSGILRHSIPTAIIAREMAINQDIRGCVPSGEVDAKFISYLIAGNQKPLLTLWRQQGATVESLGFESVKTTNIPLPPLCEQRYIAAFLDRETGRIDRLVAKKRELIERLKEKRTALISRTVTCGLPPAAARAASLPENPPLKASGLNWLGDIPVHWDVRRIATVADKITNGFVGPTRDILVDEGVRYLQSLHIKENKILFHREYYIEPAWSAAHQKSVLREGDVLIVQTGDVGQVAVVTKEFEGCNCHALIIVGPKPGKLHGPFLSWFLNSSLGFDELKRIQTGALHPHLNCGLVRDVRFACPPLAEQSAIASYLDAETAKLDALVGKVEQAVERLEEYRTALITAAVTGKIDVRTTTSPEK
jgi:type I restriction enzyme S subunit